MARQERHDEMDIFSATADPKVMQIAYLTSLLNGECSENESTGFNLDSKPLSFLHDDCPECDRQIFSSPLATKCTCKCVAEQRNAPWMTSPEDEDFSQSKRTKEKDIQIDRVPSLLGEESPERITPRGSRLSGTTRPASHEKQNRSVTFSPNIEIKRIPRTDTDVARDLFYSNAEIDCFATNYEHARHSHRLAHSTERRALGISNAYP